MRVEYHPAIEAELAEIIAYYNGRSPQLGDDFLNEFERHVLRIAAMPTRWMVMRGEIRQALMKRFPYVILFRIIGNSSIRITVIKHERRHSAYGLHGK